MNSVNPPPSRPKYREVASSILDDVKNGGDLLSKSQLELASFFQVHRLTVRHALAWLEAKHPEVTSRLRGEVVAAPPIVRTAQQKVVGFPVLSDSLAGLRFQRLNGYFWLAEAAEAELAKHNIALDIQWVGSSRDMDTQKIRYLSGMWDAVIAEPLEGLSKIGPEHAFYHCREKMAIVGILQGTRTNCVFPDFYNATQLAMSELARSGARHVLYTGSEKEMVAIRLAKVLGAEKSLDTVPDMQLSFAGSDGIMENAFSSVKHYFGNGGRCDAVLASNPYAAMGALRALLDLKLRVPDDVQLIGIGHVPFGDYFTPRPTIISTKKHALGRAAARMAMELMRHDCEPQPNVVVPMELVVGETTWHHQVEPDAMPQSGRSELPFPKVATF